MNEYHAVDQPQLKQPTLFATFYHLKTQARTNTLKCRTYQKEDDAALLLGLFLK